VSGFDSVVCARSSSPRGDASRRDAINASLSDPDALQTEVQLTEARLRAAPEEDYMSAAQLAFFRELLIRERDALLQSAHNTTLHLQEFETTPDPSDRASLEEDHTLELRVRDRERKMLHKIDAALQRIEKRDYGWCQDTGEPIGIARLLARPTTTFSVEAQAQHEVRRRMRGG
jgi:DnaK suppressor protein